MSASQVNTPHPGAGWLVPLAKMTTSPFPAQPGTQALVYVPSGFDASRPWSLVLYFRGISNTIENANKANKLSLQFEYVNPQAILVMPELLLNSKSTSPGAFAIKGAASKFTDEVVSRLLMMKRTGESGSFDLKESRPAQTIVFAHSGGYNAAASLIIGDDLLIQQCLLLDALYGFEVIFAGFVRDVAAKKRRRFFSMWTPMSGTPAHNQSLLALLKASKPPITPPVQNAIPAPLPDVCFVATKLQHDGPTGAPTLFGPLLKAIFS